MVASIGNVCPHQNVLGLDPFWGLDLSIYSLHHHLQDIRLSHRICPPLVVICPSPALQSFLEEIKVREQSSKKGHQEEVIFGGKGENFLLNTEL